jgi:glycosyltransferase involved in cell wall biosynthesis
MRSKPRPKLLLVNHFALDKICGTTVMFGEVLRLAPSAAPLVEFAYESYEADDTPEEFRARLDSGHADASCVVVINGQIEVGWGHTEAIFAWCQTRGIPAYVYAHDYWAHHLPATKTLTEAYGAHLVAATPFVAGQLEREGFTPGLIDVGIVMPDQLPLPRTPPPPKVVASVARLTARKRLADVVQGFAESGLDGSARLYLLVAPSQVFTSQSDQAEMRAIQAEIDRGRLMGVTVDRRSGQRENHDLAADWYPDYASYSVYVCPSSYEGFGMPVVEAALYGCPPLMSDIPPHRRNAEILFGDRAPDFLFPVADTRALGALLRDELTTGRRKAMLVGRIEEIRGTIASRFSLHGTAQALGQLALGAAT